MGYDTDVLIIGAGPAGLSAAKSLTQLDVPFILIHRERSPCEKKACGGFIPQRALERFEMEEFAGAYPVDAVRMRFPGTESEVVEFKEKVGVNATRYDIGRAHLSLIGRSESIWPETEATRADVTHDECHTKIVRNDEIDTISSKMLIDASGANPVTQRFMSIRDRIPNELMGYAVQYQMKLGSDSDVLRGVNDFIYGSEFSPGGYAWSFPRGREVAVGTGGLIDRVRKNEKRVEEFLEHLLKTVEPLKSELGNATVDKRESALMPLAGIVQPSFAHRIILAGDAAGHCSPITGEGIFYSMIAGELAAITSNKAIEKNDFSANELGRYEKRWTKMFGSDLKWGSWLQKRFLKEGSKSMGSAFLSSEKSQRVIAEMLLGMRSVRRAILRAAPGYARSKIGI
ncbi:MAG: geranylgeranyl reductase family protein [Candidatus Thorarchaeota archaeon]|jgi:digeranylgeranylglycerophospholipid reductase